jgi:hypothetical protein
LQACNGLGCGNDLGGLRRFEVVVARFLHGVEHGLNEGRVVDFRQLSGEIASIIIAERLVRPSTHAVLLKERGALMEVGAGGERHWCRSRSRRGHTDVEFQPSRGQRSPIAKTA